MIKKILFRVNLLRYDFDSNLIGTIELKTLNTVINPFQEFSMIFLSSIFSQSKSQNSIEMNIYSG
jgi:hypothetical protein